MLSASIVAVVLLYLPVLLQNEQPCGLGHGPQVLWEKNVYSKASHVVASVTQQSGHKVNTFTSLQADRQTLRKCCVFQGQQVADGQQLTILYWYWCSIAGISFQSFSVLGPRLWNSVFRLLRDTGHNITSFGVDISLTALVQTEH